MSTIVDPLEVYRRRAEKAEAEVERLKADLKYERSLTTRLSNALDGEEKLERERDEAREEKERQIELRRLAEKDLADIVTALGSHALPAISARECVAELVAKHDDLVRALMGGK